MKRILKDIVIIRTGLFSKPSGNGEVVYLQSKHFDEDGQLHGMLYPDLNADGISKKHLLQEGDVLFAAKGTKNFAAVFENRNEPSVASTSFFVISSTDNKVMPQYLAWFLNNPSTQTLLKGHAIGTSIPSISKQVLENLEIPVPEIKTQKAIVEISKLRKKEKSLKQKIETLTEKLIQQQIINAVK